MRVFLIAIIFAPSGLFAYSVGLIQSFGSNGYRGTHLPFTFLSTGLDADGLKRLELVTAVSFYRDDLVESRFFSIEPRLRVYAESEAGIGVRYRLVPKTDGYSSQEFGVEVRYTVFKHKPQRGTRFPFIEEVEILLELYRRTHSDELDITRSIRPRPLETSETVVVLGARLLHREVDSVRPNAEIQIAKSFYSSEFSPVDRPSPVTPVLGLTPFVQGYLSTTLLAALFWRVGNPEGFALEPRLFYLHLSAEGNPGHGDALGASLSAGTDGFSVRMTFEALKRQLLDWRNFLTLGATVSF